MMTFTSVDRSSPPSPTVREEDTQYNVESSDSSEEDASGLASQLPRRIESIEGGKGSDSTLLILSEDELDELLAVARQCKAQAKTVADSLLHSGPDHITESNAVYGLERQMAELQDKIRALKQ